MSWSLRSHLPDWAVVVLVSAVVGAISAVLSVAVYREALVEEDEPLPVPSESDDGTN